MPILHETTYDVDTGKFDAFQEWLLDNEDALAEAYPDGIEYVGTFATVVGDQSSGAYKTILRLENYAAMDTLSATIAEEGELNRLLWEMSAYTEGGATARGQQILWKKVSEAVATGD